MPIVAGPETVRHPLTAGDPVLNGRHSHSNDKLTGYMIVSTSFLPGCAITLTDVEPVWGATNYGDALELVHALRDKYASDRYAYAVIAHLYECGCRSDGEVRFSD
jgi:hypothetical protein